MPRFEGFINAGGEIFRADLRVEAVLFHNAEGVLRNSGEDVASFQQFIKLIYTDSRKPLKKRNVGFVRLLKLVQRNMLLSQNALGHSQVKSTANTDGHKKLFAHVILLVVFYVAVIVRME